MCFYINWRNEIWWRRYFVWINLLVVAVSAPRAWQDDCCAVLKGKLVIFGYVPISYGCALEVKILGMVQISIDLIWVQEYVLIFLAYLIIDINMLIDR